MGKLIQKRVGKSNFSPGDEWNTTRDCHQCFEPLTEVCFEKEEAVEGENKERVRKKVAYLRGLRRCCSAQSDIKNNNSAEDNPHTSPSRITCPIGGAFVDRNGNAVTNIALKLFQTSTVNDSSCTAPSCSNLSIGVT